MARTTVRKSTIIVVMMLKFMMMMMMKGRIVMVLTYLNYHEHLKRVGRYEIKSGWKSYTVMGLK